MAKTYSWTEVQLAEECGQKYIWRYQHQTDQGVGIRERVTAESRPMILGSAVHKGIETYLRLKSERPTLTHQGRLLLASEATRAYVKKDTKPHQQKWDWGTKQLIFDSDYYAMMTEVADAACEILMHYTPAIPADWQIATKDDVLPSRYDDARGEQLTLEWEIFHTLPGGQGFKGIVDAVIKDGSGNLFLVDWKVKSKFPWDEMASMDGQLHLYAAVLNANGANIKQVCMYQMLSNPPAVCATGTGKNLGQILTGAQTYATTWEYWCETAPMGTNLAHYEPIMRPKLKTMDYFIRPVYSPITKASSAFAISNFQKGVDMIEAGHLPARVSTYTCQSCFFASLCDAKRYDTDLDFIIERQFDKGGRRG
jgi:hypothetical protein